MNATTNLPADDADVGDGDGGVEDDDDDDDDEDDCNASKVPKHSGI